MNHLPQNGWFMMDNLHAWSVLEKSSLALVYCFFPHVDCVSVLILDENQVVQKDLL